MSVTVDYFFNAGLPLRKLATRINDSLGLSLAPYQGDQEDLFCRYLALELSLGRRELLDDGPCDFESFEFELSSRTSASDTEPRAYQVELMVIAAFALHLRLGIHEGLLVFDIQTPLARYALKETNHEKIWIDRLSDQPVILPQHFESVAGRIQGADWR